MCTSKSCAEIGTKLKSLIFFSIHFKRGIFFI
uniref:Uncharacterized protein n=1 Tax=Myoviridae sp. ctjhW4 TaxID=2825162 RepID=A0A8S5PS56_9CAUD|nr:MAG TPA: hypothetical protein [Myoviridae sp. ctjhW4]